MDRFARGDQLIWESEQIKKQRSYGMKLSMLTVFVASAGRLTHCSHEHGQVDLVTQSPLF